MLTMTGFTFVVRSTSRQITSAAMAEPPPVSTRKTTAPTSGFSRAFLMDSAIVYEPTSRVPISGMVWLRPSTMSPST
jgi:hypothetical protein